MNDQRRNSIGLVALMLLTSVFLFSACGNSQKKSTAAASAPNNAAAVGMSTCASCHTVVVAEWMTGGHANLDPAGNLYSAGAPTLGQISGCTTNCHDPLSDSNNLTTGYTGNVPRPVVGCEACHGGGSLHANAGGSGAISLLSGSYAATSIGSTAVSGQFVMCTTCHELLDSSGTTTNSSPTHLTTAPTGTAYTITDTHYATFGDFTGAYDGNTTLNSRNITGYAMDYLEDRVCSTCHNPHKQANIHREWALSAHADMTSNFEPDSATKDPYGYFSGAWAHYNWGNAANYRACQRCHTTTGFITYANARLDGDTQLALDIQHGVITLLSSSPSGSFKPEMLKCNGCHTDNKGSLRNPGAVTANYDYPIPLAAGAKPYAVASYAYPDVKGSNVCMACHVGRESGDTVKGLNDPGLVNVALQSAGTNSFFDFTKNGFINSHYLTAGGTVFGATGYHFAGRSYTNPPTYRHINIGSSAVPNTGTNGPCVGCHMSRPGGSGDHLFLPVTRSTTTPGHIDSIASEVCLYCHTVSGAGGLEDLINERKEEYHEAIEATIYVLDKRGIFFRQASPYFYGLRAQGTTGAVTNASPIVTVASTSGVNGVETSTSADFFKVDSDGTYYRIKTAIDGTHLELDKDYEGTSGNPVSYSIIKSTSSSLRTGSTVSAVSAIVTQGSVTVTVSGALYSSGAVTICPTTCSATKPDIFKVEGIENQYKITAVSDNGLNTSTITLESGYRGASAAAANFSILKSGDRGLRSWLSQGDTDNTGNATGRHNLGAAFNLNLLEHDPGGYVHNRVYAKRLLYDSIDWADDNVMNYSVGATLNALVIDGAAPAWKTGAMKYLLPSGVLGIAAERP